MDNIEVKIAITLKINSQSIYNTYPDINKYIEILLKQFWIATWKTYKASPFHKSIKNFYDLQTVESKIQPKIANDNNENQNLKHSKFLSYLYLLSRSQSTICEKCNIRSKKSITSSLIALIIMKLKRS